MLRCPPNVFVGIPRSAERLVLTVRNFDDFDDLQNLLIFTSALVIDIGANFDASSRLIVAYNFARGQAFDISKKLRLALTFSTGVLSQEDVAMLFVQTFQ